MTRKVLKPLASLAVMGLTMLPVPAQAAPLDATSVYTAQFGSAPGFTPPDANGDMFATFFDGGTITGAFNAQPVANASRGIVWQLNYVLHTRTGVLQGTGTAQCNQCTVAGITGSVSFTVTASGHGTVSTCGPSASCVAVTAVTIDAGTWTISAATGALTGIAGSGSWTQANLSPHRFLTGSITSGGCDATGNGNDDDECED